MKYAPKKVFILENVGYTEISYEELCRLEEIDAAYREKLFLPLHGMLMEVPPNVYDAFYKEQRRQKYIDECSKENGDFSYDALTSNDFNGEDILIDAEKDIAEQVTDRIMSEQLRVALSLLSEDEKCLIYRYYYEEISETELAIIYGISQQAVSKRISKIRKKLKKFMKI